MSKKPDLAEVMDDVANYVAAINGLKWGLINEGWDPKNAEDVVTSQLTVKSQPQCRVCGHDPKGSQ